MKEILDAALEKAKEIMCFSTTMVFVLTGIYMWVIDGSDLKTKDMTRELSFFRIVAISYIVGSLGLFTLLKFLAR